MSERFDTPSNSPLSLALVSKQYSSLNCISAPSCCHTGSPPKSLECWHELFPGSVIAVLREEGVFINAIEEVNINHLPCVRSGAWITFSYQQQDDACSQEPFLERNTGKGTENCTESSKEAISSQGGRNPFIKADVGAEI